MHRHGRFLIALVLGLAIAALAHLPLAGRVLAGADAFFVTYLVLTARHARRLTAEQLRRTVSSDDEGGRMILLLAVGIVVASVFGVAALLNGALADLRYGVLLGVAAVPLGWTTLHTLMAFRYADLFYDVQGGLPLEFAGKPPVPELWDFLYFSFTLGMTAQTSDTGIATTRLRRVATLHSVLSFFYNTVILALAVNAAVSLGT